MEAKNINSSFFKKPYISLESTDLEKSSNIEKVICIIVWLIIQTLGNFLIIGIIQYERFGGDPLKRRITDQVKKGKKVFFFLIIFCCIFKLFTMSFIHLVILNVISPSMRLAYVLIPWNIGYWLDFIFHYLRISYSLYIVIFFNEYLILKYYIEFIWKRVPPLDHDFTSTCLNILNSFMSLVFGIIEIICSFEIDTLEYEKMTGPIAYRSKMMMQKSRYLLNTFICTTCTWYNLLV